MKKVFLVIIKDKGNYPVDNIASCVFEGTQVHLKVRKQIVYTTWAKPNDVFSVEENNGMYLLRKVELPKRKGLLIAWLLRFSKFNREKDPRRLESTKQKECQRCRWYGSNCEKKTFVSSGYNFTVCEAENRTGYKCVAGWFSDAITKDEVKELIRFMGFYDEAFVKYILRQNFGISEKEFQKAMADKTPIF